MTASRALLEIDVDGCASGNDLEHLQGLADNLGTDPITLQH
jgi:hypothetical protein